MPRKKAKATKKENGRGSIDQLPSGKYRWRITLRRSDGTPYTRTGTASSRPAAQRAIDLMNADHQQGNLPEPSRVTMTAYLNTWLETKRPGLARKSMHNYSRLIELHINPQIGQIPLQKLSALHLQALYNALTTQRLGDTQRQVHNVLHAALEHALRLDLINKNPASRIRPTLPRRQPGDGVVDKALTAEEVDRLLPVLRQSRWGVIFEFFLHTGLRRAEVCGLKWEHVDLDKGTLRIKEGVVVVNGKADVDATKSPLSARPLKLTAEAVDCLRRQRAIQAQERDALLPGPMQGHAKAKSRVRPWIDSGYVFTALCGTRLYPDVLLRHLKRFGTEAGIKKVVNNHVLRHTYASLMLRAGVPMEVVSQKLGHARPSTTSDFYRTVYPDEHDVWALDLSDLTKHSKDPEDPKNTEDSEDSED
ncbi:tyrosine-type recombinase/integrase [Deinococcus humi]|uniref:Integrase n=1 Tax=Deinococcus humi TaxID=662880 RepID=A0A7W8K0B4_9DEIO|nr:tyrosine-type recombinase/integrase [Deinococcus humi]MBB5364884.1 integrase [Deinococcus humi]GGO33774.1 site-specific integrase [Deinococcus humi]